MTRHRATFSLVQPDQPTPGTLPDGHLETINTLQARKGKPALRAGDVIARPIRLFGNELTSYFTRVPDADLRTLADQINADGGPMLSAHVTDETPMGTFYAAEIVPGDARAAPDPGQPAQPLSLDTWAYWLNDDAGQDLVRRIDGGIINEASIGYWYDQVICSITGGSYYDSPYWAGRTYDVVNPETGDTTTRLCFIWTTGTIAFAEGSLVYRGAYPGTRVGGSTDPGTPVAAANAGPSGPTTTTRFQLAASRDMTGVLDKKVPAQHAGGSPPISPPIPADPTPQEDSVTTVTLKLADGSAKELTPEAVQDVLNAERQTAQDKGTQAERERISAALGLDPRDAEGSTALNTLKSEAQDGRTYRGDLLDELQALTVTLSGRGDGAEKAAERARRAYSALSITDIREEVTRLRAQRDALVPGGQLSRDQEDAAPTRRPVDLDAV